ncbi:hypothetical protein [Iningainema tapete]|uniref:Uncharacterized protein n=1 Tax=Iningainema tapete BLCC-T55 TaxID=2748662 RepID=A0A8J6XII8_9CYAN|nr:hypothetical protein [Iningainema tapete]MBD2773006.1 hypothetical protein [Iningainema tapete BLCC-T55]
MKTQRKKGEQITLYLTQVLTGYEVIPANWGWHIHKADEYCGHLEYQAKLGWDGSALNCLPMELREKLKNFTQSTFSMSSATT